MDHRYLQRCDACRMLKEPAIPSTVTSAACTVGRNNPIPFSDMLVRDSLQRQTEDDPMDMTITAEDESAEECDSLSESQSAESVYSTQSEDTIRATKLALEVEAEVRADSTAILNSSDYAVDADEGFFDKQLGSPISTSSGASTPPPVSHIMPHPSNVIQHSSLSLVREGTT